MSLLNWRRISSGSFPLEVNKLAILGLGSEYQFFINGVKGADINDPRASGGGVGFLVINEPNEDSVVEFDNFRSYVPRIAAKSHLGGRTAALERLSQNIGPVKNDWSFFPFRKLRYSQVKKVS